MMLEIWAYGIFSILGILISYYLGVFEGAHYTPTTNETVTRMLKMAELQPGDKLADVGSGDGRILIGAAQKGLESVGYEINPALVFWSRTLISRAGVSTLAKAYTKNFWNINFSKFTVVTVYGLPHMLKPLQKKLERELKPGSRVICNTFPFLTKNELWEVTKESNIYRYVKK
jgi:cyclopropane fatty-acyl-phospholipid synthase-like methyltransferase